MGMAVCVGIERQRDRESVILVVGEKLGVGVNIVRLCGTPRRGIGRREAW